MLDWLTVISLAITGQAPTVAPPLPAERKADVVAILPITGEIDSITTASLRRRLAQANAIGADSIVLELNTPGGSLLDTLEITHIIRNEAPANTVAWIHPFAFSAGTVIALSAREIVTSPDAMFGDAAPVTPLGPIPATERAKVESPLLAEVIDAARLRGYDEQLVQAFVSVGIELWMLRHHDGGQVVFVGRDEYESVYGAAPPQALPPITPPDDGSEIEVHPLLSMLAGMQAGAADDGEALGGEPLRLATPRAILGPQDATDYDVVGQVVPADRLLTLKPWQAELYGLSRGTVADDEAMRRWLGASTVVRIEPDWSESMVQVLMSWPIRISLVAVLVICILIEMALPGTGWFGLGALVALAGLVGAPALIGMADWWDLAAIGLGLILIATELLLIPGTLIAGLTGAVLVLFGLVSSAVSGDLTSDASQTLFVQGGVIVLIGAAIGLLIGGVVIRKLGGIRSGPLVLEDMVGQQPALHDDDTPQVGATGVAVTDLRPSGRVRVDDRVVDAVCSGRWIEAGTPIRFVSCGLICHVEPIDS